jgi:hypothetical protein
MTWDDVTSHLLDATDRSAREAARTARTHRSPARRSGSLTTRTRAADTNTTALLIATEFLPTT